MKYLLFRSLILGFVVCMGQGVGAQETHELHNCGMTAAEHELQLQRLIANQKRLQLHPELNLRSKDVRYVPITFILTAASDGVGYPQEESVLQQMEAINTAWERYDYVFYMDEVKYVANDLIYNSPSSSGGEFQMKKVKDGNAMNVYVTLDANSGNNQPGLTLAYYSNQNDWIVIRKDRFGGNELIMPHEMGHFFSLEHTFFGWECEPYDEALHGNPVNSTFTPCLQNWRVEFADGTNCTNSGDRICDTPPDYNFGGGWSVDGDRCADYDVGTQDPRGVVVNPMENNYMSYFFDCAQYEFTNGQQNVMLSDYQSSARSYLRTGVVPNTAEVTNEISHIYPINDEVTQEFETVVLDWEDVPGANKYLVIIDRLPNFATGERYTVDASEASIQGLELSRRYYWKVWPYNETNTGAGYGETQQFITGLSSAVEEITSVENLTLYPNPVTGNQLVVSFESAKALDYDLRVFNASGQLVTTINTQRAQSNEAQMHQLNTSNFGSGLFILQIVSDEGVLSRKFSVQ